MLSALEPGPNCDLKFLSSKKQAAARPAFQPVFTVLNSRTGDLKPATQRRQHQFHFKRFTTARGAAGRPRRGQTVAGNGGGLSARSGGEAHRAPPAAMQIGADTAQSTLIGPARAGSKNCCCTDRTAPADPQKMTSMLSKCVSESKAHVADAWAVAQPPTVARAGSPPSAASRATTRRGTRTTCRASRPSRRRRRTSSARPRP